MTSPTCLRSAVIEREIAAAVAVPIAALADTGTGRPVSFAPWQQAGTVPKGAVLLSGRVHAAQAAAGRCCKIADIPCNGKGRTACWQCTNSRLQRINDHAECQYILNTVLREYPSASLPSAVQSISSRSSNDNPARLKSHLYRDFEVTRHVLRLLV